MFGGGVAIASLCESRLMFVVVRMAMMIVCTVHVFQDIPRLDRAAPGGMIEYSQRMNKIRLFCRTARSQLEDESDRPTEGPFGTRTIGNECTQFRYATIERVMHAPS